MLSDSLEGALMLTVFQLLVSGLVLSSALAIVYRQKESRKVLLLTAAGFIFYCLYFILQGWFLYRGLSQPAAMGTPALWEGLAQGLEKAALVLLGASFFSGLIAKRSGKWFFAALATVFIVLIGTPWLVAMHSGLSFRAALSAVFNGIGRISFLSG